MQAKPGGHQRARARIRRREKGQEWQRGRGVNKEARKEGGERNDPGERHGRLDGKGGTR